MIHFLVFDTFLGSLIITSCQETLRLLPEEILFSLFVSLNNKSPTLTVSFLFVHSVFFFSFTLFPFFSFILFLFVLFSRCRTRPDRVVTRSVSRAIAQNQSPAAVLSKPFQDFMTQWKQKQEKDSKVSQLLRRQCDDFCCLLESIVRDRSVLSGRTRICLSCEGKVIVRTFLVTNQEYFL